MISERDKITKDRVKMSTESVLLFRNHHVLCDGVSLSAVMSDASDEAKELNDMMLNAIKNRRKMMRTASIASCIYSLTKYYVVGSSMPCRCNYGK